MTDWQWTYYFAFLLFRGFVSTLLSVFLIIAPLQLIAQKPSVTLKTNATHIGVLDTLELTLKITSAEKIASLDPSLAEFRILKGPFTSEEENISIKNSVPVTTHTLNMSYALQPKRTGAITIGPVKAKGETGTIYQSDLVVIEVVRGRLDIGTTSIGKDDLGTMFDIFSGEHDHHCMDTFSKEYPYVLTAGPVYVDSTQALPKTEELKAIVRDINECLDRKATHGKSEYGMGRLPRYYCTVADTTGLAQALELVCSKYASHIRCATLLYPLKDWNPGYDQAAASNEKQYWREADEFYKLLSARGFDFSRVIPVLFRFHFKTDTDAARWKAFAVLQGFRVSEEKKDDYASPYMILLPKDSRAVTETLYKMIRVLNKEMSKRYPVPRGFYNGLEVRLKDLQK